MAFLDKDILPTTYEFSSIEDWFMLIDSEVWSIADCLFAVILYIEIICEQWLGSRSPPCAAQNVFFDQRSIGINLMVTRPPAHGSFDQFRTNYQYDIPWHRSIESACTTPMKCRVALCEINYSRTADLYTFCCKNMDKFLKLLACSSNMFGRKWLPSPLEKKVSLTGWHSRFEGDMPRRYCCSLNMADDYLFERVPFIIGMN